MQHHENHVRTQVGVDATVAAGAAAVFHQKPSTHTLDVLSHSSVEHTERIVHAIRLAQNLINIT